MTRMPLPRPVEASGESPGERMPNILRKPNPPIVAILLGPPKTYFTHYHHDQLVGKRITRGCYGENCPRCKFSKPYRQHYAAILVYRSRGGIAAAKRSPIESWDPEILAIPHYSLGKFQNDRNLGLVVEISTHRDQLSVAIDPAGGPHTPAFPVPRSFDVGAALTRFFFPEEWQCGESKVDDEATSRDPQSPSDEPAILPLDPKPTTPRRQGGAG
ncbi:MAG: hypothetical protein KF873_02165 [Gemmataceae bacterium]|nr:hypothetical protein [Gemmataceae bacterium]